MAPKAPYLPSGTVLHTSRGRSPQPVREASAGPGQNPWRPGPKARRRHQPSRRKTTVGRLNGRPFYGQAKGQLRPTCTSYAGCAHQPSGILESTAQVPVPVPIPTAPQAPEPSRPSGIVPKSRQPPFEPGLLSSSFSSTTGTPALTRASASTPRPLIFFPLKVPS